MMPPSEDGSTSSRASPDLDSPDSESNVWVDVQPPGTPGSLRGQQRARTSSVWSVISQALRRAQLAGAEVEGDMTYHRAYHRPDTMDLTEYLTASDTEYLTASDTGTHTVHEPSRPATPASQASSSPRGRNDRPQQPPHTHTHGGGSDVVDDDTPPRRQQQQQQQQPAWTWRTLLLVDDEADHLGLGAHNCAAIALGREDAASPAALRARVLAALARMARFSGAAYHGPAAPPAGWTGCRSMTWAEVCIAWCLLPATGAAAQVRGGWALTRLTALVSPAAGHGGQVGGDGDGEEAAWLGENLEVAASGLGGALLVVRVGPCGAGGEGEGQEEEEEEDYGEDDGCSITLPGAVAYGGDQGREVLDYSIEESRDVCLSPDFFGLHEC